MCDKTELAEDMKALATKYGVGLVAMDNHNIDFFRFADDRFTQASDAIVYSGTEESMTLRNRYGKTDFDEKG